MTTSFFDVTTSLLVDAFLAERGGGVFSTMTMKKMRTREEGQGRQWMTTREDKVQGQMRTRKGTTTEDDKVSNMGNVANKRVLYQQFADRGEEEEASISAPWTDVDEAGLVALTNAPIKIANTLWAVIGD